MSLLIAALALAAQAQPGAAPAKPAGKPKMICTEEVQLGSRLPGKRICRTAADWERDRREARDDVERAQRLNKLPGQ